VAVEDVVAFLFGWWDRIVEAEDDMLGDLPTVIVWKIAARVPAFLAHLAIVS